jgi:hypothetical protein
MVIWSMRDAAQCGRGHGCAERREEKLSFKALSTLLPGSNFNL